MTTTPAASAGSVVRAETLGFDFYGTRGQCQRIRAEVTVVCLDLGLRPRFIQTGFGRLRSRYEVRISGSRTSLLALQAWRHDVLRG